MGQQGRRDSLKTIASIAESVKDRVETVEEKVGFIAPLNFCRKKLKCFFTDVISLCELIVEYNENVEKAEYHAGIVEDTIKFFVELIEAYVNLTTSIENTLQDDYLADSRKIYIIRQRLIETDERIEELKDEFGIEDLKDELDKRKMGEG